MTQDLRNHPNWQPEQRHWAEGNWTIDLWSEPRLPGEPSFDAYLVDTTPDKIRAAALDAVVNLAGPTPHATARRGLDQTLEQLRTVPGDPAHALLAASAALCDPDLRPRQRNPMLTAAVADLDPHAAAATLAVSADSEVWARCDQGWVPVLGSDMLTPQARQAWSRAAAGTAGSRDLFLRQEELLDDPDVWAYPALGMVPHPRLRRTSLTGIQELVVSTDGAKLTADRCADLRGWLTGGLQVKPAGSKHPSPHGDVTVLHVRYTTPAP